MEDRKTIAERLREVDVYNGSIDCAIKEIVDGSDLCGKIYDHGCRDCMQNTLNAIADMIEAEQAELREKVKLAHALTKGAMHQLPEGIEWPRFEDGELVRFGDKTDKGTVYSVDFSKSIYTLYQSDSFQAGRGMYGEPVKRPEPEVLDADGVPIKVGDTVWYVDHAGKAVERTVERFGKSDFHPKTRVFFENKNWMPPNELTHRKPDTQEAIDNDTTIPPRSYYAERIGHDTGLKDDEEIYVAVMRDLLARQRKLLGGE